MSSALDKFGRFAHDRAMISVSPDRPRHGPLALWLLAALLGPVAVVMMSPALPQAPAAMIAGPILAISLMAAGMIPAAVSGRLGVGAAAGVTMGLGFVLADAFGAARAFALSPAVPAVLIASLSFAARGALFARSSGKRGWWIAVSVVAGEAAILLTAMARPDSLPRWLLALLPAQWASTAFQSAAGGSGALAASSALLALGGTAATTLLVAILWPRRWPYLLMFAAWLAASALVYYRPAPALSVAGEGPALTASAG